MGISHFRAAIRNPEIFLKSAVRSLFQFPCVFANSGFRIYPPLDLAKIGNFSTRVSKGISHFRAAIQNPEIFLKSAVRSLFQFPWVFGNSGFRIYSPLDLAKIGNFSTRVPKGISNFRAAILALSLSRNHAWSLSCFYSIPTARFVVRVRAY